MSQVQQQPTLAENLLHSLVIDGKPIMEMRITDGYCNLSKLCAAGEKRVNNYTQLEGTKAYINELSLTTGIPVDKIIESKEGRYGGSYCHPKIAIHCAQWISPRFSLAVTDLVMEFMAGRITTDQSKNAFQKLKESVSSRDHEYRMTQERNKSKELDIRQKELEMQQRQLGQKLMLDAEQCEGVLLKQTLRDAGINLMCPTSVSAQGEIYYDVSRILSEMGISLQNSGKMGKLIAGRYRSEFKKEPEKQEKVVAGSMRICNVYPKSEVAMIKSWLSE